MPFLCDKYTTIPCFTPVDVFLLNHPLKMHATPWFALFHLRFKALWLPVSWTLPGVWIFGAEQSWEAAHTQQATSVTVRSPLVQTTWFVNIRVSPFCSAYTPHDDIPYRRTRKKMTRRRIIATTILTVLTCMTCGSYGGCVVKPVRVNLIIRDKTSVTSTM